MEWFTGSDLAELRDVAEGLMTASAQMLRAGADAYYAVATLKCQIVPPGYKQASEKNVAPYPHLRGVPLGTIKVPVGSDVRAKDRALIGGRLFEVVAPLAGRTIEIRLKFLVREIQQPERELYLALKPEGGYDGATNVEALPELVRVLPVPFISDKGTDVITAREGPGAEIATLKQIEVSEIALDYLADATLARILYFLVLNSGSAPTAEQARDRIFPRYLLTKGSTPSFENHQWAAMFPWSVALVEER